MGRRNKSAKIHGWLVLDKPVGMTSTQAVSRTRRLIGERKAGHAGTLDPMASGCLPIAFGEATKTVPFVMDSLKTYRFTVRWGVETDTGDTEGTVVAESDHVPDAGEIDAILPQFVGLIRQVPPRYSAIKVDGARAYDLARDGEEFDLQEREVEIIQLERDGTTQDGETVLWCECGKGTYVRALVRDIAHALGTVGHISALRRQAVGPFDEEDMIPLERLEEMWQTEAGQGTLTGSLRPVETALDDIPALAVDLSEANRLKNGQPVLLRGRDAPVLSGLVYATNHGKLVALAEAERGELHPKRVFNLPG